MTQNETNIIFVGYNSPLRGQLCEYGSMDDCAYVLLVPHSEMAECHHDADDAENVSYEPRNMYIENMLRGSYLNRWTVGKINGVEYGIGYAYHY